MRQRRRRNPGRRRRLDDAELIAKRLAIFSPGGIGGGPFSQGQPAIARITERLAARFDVTFYSLAQASPGFEARGFRFRAPPAAVERAGVRGARWLALAARFAADQVRRPCDALLSFWGYPMGAYAVALGRLARRPTAVVLLGAETADLPAINYGHLGRRASRRRLLRACARADALVAVSRFQLDRLAAHDFRREDAHVVPLGAEAEMFPFAPKPPGTPLKIIHVSNLTEVKDQATLLRGFARLRVAIDARLRIVGADHMRGEMQRLARTLAIGDHLEFTGPVPYAEMPAHYSWADMAVLTSLSEGQNRGLTEAAMCGVLLVGTPVGHLADLGEDAAVLVKMRDPEHLARRIQEIAADGAGWRRRVDAARAWAAAHDIEWTVARLGEIIDGLI